MVLPKAISNHDYLGRHFIKNNCNLCPPMPLAQKREDGKDDWRSSSGLSGSPGCCWTSFCLLAKGRQWPSLPQSGNHTAGVRESADLAFSMDFKVEKDLWPALEGWWRCDDFTSASRFRLQLQRTRSNTRYNIELRWYAHNIKLAISKYTTQWHWIYPQSCATTTIKFQNLFNTPKGNLAPLSSLPPPPPFSLPRPKQPPTCFLPLWAYLFWIFPVSGIPIHDLVFLASLTSCNVFEHNVAHHHFLSSYGWVIFYCVATLFF